MFTDPAVKMAQRIARRPVHIGPIQSPVAGRTDHVPLNVPSGSYVIPADIVSGVGQGNSQAGHHALSRTFSKMMPSGHATNSGFGRIKQKGFKAGGTTDKGSNEPVEIMAAGGEFVVPREAVMHIGAGNMKRGHEILDEYVKAERAKLVKTLKKLPGPAKN
jgi:hypothetical protein